MERLGECDFASKGARGVAKTFGPAAQHDERGPDLPGDSDVGLVKPLDSQKPRTEESYAPSLLLWGGCLAVLLAYILLPRTQPYYA